MAGTTLGASTPEFPSRSSSARALPDLFGLVMIDEAMQPDIRAGWTVRLSPRHRLSPGRVVLVRSGDRGCYIRRFQPLSDDHWRAVPSHPGFASLDSITDELEVLAVMTGYDLPDQDNARGCA